ncbi:MAG: tetratricopeptide repeat protein [Bacteroidales bacterium]|nr:tetratricopeptide repeat protein [Bacteroidales bacterium]
MRYIVHSIFLFLILAVSCSHSFDARLKQVNELSEKNPRAAIAMLDTIDAAHLSQRDKHYMDFLRIKTADKAYIQHTSDSAILRELDYFMGDRLYPEVLYYGARVYSDMGDYPSALSYFKQALEATPLDENPLLRSRILSQTGRMLNTIKLHSDALPYLKECLHVDSIIGDTFKLVYNHILIAEVYLNLNDLSSANAAVKSAREWGVNSPPEDKAQIDLSLAQVQYKRGNIDDALTLIRDVPHKIEVEFRNEALLYAAYIYKYAGIIDTAYMYANELIQSNYINNKRPAYRLILSTSLKEMIPPDSVHAYLNHYDDALNYYYNAYEAEEAVLQKTQYNYETQQRKRIQAETSRSRVLVWVFVLLSSLLALVCVVFYLILRNKNKEIRLHEVLQQLEQMNKQGLAKAAEDENPQLTPLEILNNRLRNELGVMFDPSLKITADPTFSRSVTAQKIEKYLDQKIPLRDSDPLWTEIEELINTNSPRFFKFIEKLTNSQLTLNDQQLIMLLKFGFTVTEISHLLSRTKATITMRRKKLCSKISTPSIEPEIFDNIVRHI